MKLRTPKFSILILILFFLVGLLAGFFLRSDDTDIDPSDAVVEVTSYSNNGNLVGSGFLIENGVVITTSHGIGDPTSELYVNVP